MLMTLRCSSPDEVRSSRTRCHQQRATESIQADPHQNDPTTTAIPEQSLSFPQIDNIKPKTLLPYHIDLFSISRSCTSRLYSFREQCKVRRTDKIGLRPRGQLISLGINSRRILKVYQ